MNQDTHEGEAGVPGAGGGGEEAQEAGGGAEGVAIARGQGGGLGQLRSQTPNKPRH